jgi:hypothetical protein
MSNNEREDPETDPSDFGVPDAPAPTPKIQENLPDWAKITSNIAEEADENDVSSVPEQGQPPVQSKKKGFGSNDEDLSEQELFLDDGTNNPVAPLPSDTDTSPSEPSVIEGKPPQEATPAYKEKSPAKSTSRSVPDYEEEDTEEPNTQTVSTKKVLRIPSAKNKPAKQVKSAKKVRKAVSSGLVETDPEILSPQGRMAGNRWKLIALRFAIWGTLGIVVLTGILTIVGPKGPNLSAVTTQVLSNLNRNNFPIEAGQQVASRFIKEYLAYNPSETQERAGELANYIIGSGTEENSIITILSSREQRVIGEPVLAMPVELVSDNHVVYTFAIQVFQPAVKKSEDSPALIATPPTWVYLAIPMVSDEAGAVGVSGMPAFVSQPQIAGRGEAITLREDTDANRDARAQIEKFLLYWASSDEVSLKPYIVDELTTSAATEGLGGTLTFISLESLIIEALPKDYIQDPEVAITCSAPEYNAPCRDAYITVGWEFRGIELSNKYRLIVLFDGQNWRVVDIRGTNFGKVGG